MGTAVLTFFIGMTLGLLYAEASRVVEIKWRKENDEHSRNN